MPLYVTVRIAPASVPMLETQTDTRGSRMTACARLQR